MFQKRTLIVSFVAILLGLTLGAFFFRSSQKAPSKKVSASSETSTITTQADWNVGIKSNIDDNSSPGQIKMDDAAIIGTKFDLQNLFQLSPSSFTTKDCRVDQTNFQNIFDNNTNSHWLVDNLGVVKNPPFCPLPGMINPYLYIDLGQNQSFAFAKFHVSYIGGGTLEGPLTNAVNIQFAQEGFEFNNIMSLSSPTFQATGSYSFNPGMGDFNQYKSVSERINNVRYVRIMIDPSVISLNEIELYNQSSAIHTTGVTQIDGGENFWQWETFTDSKTTPFNTSVTYRYRSSADGLTWNPWHSSIGAVESRSGDDSDSSIKYRYLQIEATLTNTDGTSTPTIDSYSIGYHTNQKPNAPTAMTAVIN